VLAAGATAIALPLGTLLAVLVSRFDLPGRRWFAAALGLLLFLPLYVQLSGWDAALGKLGWYTILFGSIGSEWLAGMRGAIFVHGLAAVPWVALLVGVGLLAVDPAQEEAALLVAPPGVVLLRITLPQVAPFVFAAAIWTAVSTTAEMTVTNIYLVDTYTEAFYNVFALSADVQAAARAALPGVASLAVVLLLTLAMVAQVAHRRTLAALSRPVAFCAGPWRPLLAGLVWLVVFVLLAVPVASLVSKAGFVVLTEGDQRVRSWSGILAVARVVLAPREFRAEFGWTLLAAVPAAVLALAVSAILAWMARRGGWRSAPAVGAIVTGLAVPGPLVGVAIIWLMNRESVGGPFDPLIYLYDRTPLAPVLAQTVRALPLTILLLWRAFASLNDDVLAAAALDGLSPWQTLVRIALPQRWKGLAAAGLAAFAVAAGDLAWSLLVLPPGMDTIQRRVFGLVHSGVEEQVAAISLVTLAAYAIIAGAVLLLVRRQAVR
jgi:iron(III) transport system permease protein